jgi:hypothetical protein
MCKLRRGWNTLFALSLSFNKVFFFRLGEKGFRLLPVKSLGH